MPPRFNPALKSIRRSEARARYTRRNSKGGVTQGEAARELHHYATVLRSLTGGRGIHQEEFSHYEEMPRELEARVIEEGKRARAAAHGHG